MQPDGQLSDHFTESEFCSKSPLVINLEDKLLHLMQWMVILLLFNENQQRVQIIAWGKIFWIWCLCWILFEERAWYSKKIPAIGSTATIFSWFWRYQGKLDFKISRKRLWIVWEEKETWYLFFHSTVLVSFFLLFSWFH